MPHRFGSLSLIIGCLTLGTLTGCTTAPLEPVAAPTSTATEAPAPLPVGPSPRIDLTCDDVIDVAALQTFVGVNGQPLALVAPADRLTPDTAAVEQFGALTCSWTNGLAGSHFTGPHPDGQTVMLSILPEGLDAAVAYVDLYRLADPTYGEHVQGPRCLGPADGTASAFCELYGVIGQTWVELTLNGIVASSDVGADDLVAGFREVFDPMIAAVSSASPRERWTPAAPSGLSASDCESLAPTAPISEVTAIPDLAVGPRWDGPRVGQYWYSTGEIGALRCSLGLSGSDLAVGQIGILPGGAWAFDRFAEEWRAQGGMSIELADIAVGNAISRCADTSTECLIDFTNGSDWIRIGVYPTPSPDMADRYPIAYFESARVAAPQIAAIVADHVAEYLAGS